MEDFNFKDYRRLTLPVKRDTLRAIPEEDTKQLVVVLPRPKKRQKVVEAIKRLYGGFKFPVPK